MRQCVMHKNHNFALDILELLSFNHLQCYFLSLYNSITFTGILTILQSFVKHIQRTCHAQEP